MNIYVYNSMLLVGVGLTGAGAGLVSIPLGLVVTGALVIGLTIYNVRLVGPR